MVRIGLPVNVVNIIKFFVMEVLVSYVLEPAWELIISRSTHQRVVRGEKVPLTSIAHSRTFPCAIASGRVTTVIAIVLSLLVLGGSFLSEYAVDAVVEYVESTDTALVYTLQDGRKSDEPSNLSKETSIRISTAVAFIADRCHYFDEQTNSYRVNASFVNATTEEKACVNNNPNMSYPVPDVCTMPKGIAHDFDCFWNGRTFYKSRTGPQTIEYNWFNETDQRNGDRSVIVHSCDFDHCTQSSVIGEAERFNSSRLYCLRPRSRSAPYCLYVSTRWVVLSKFDMETATPHSAVAVLVYRNMRGDVRAFEPMSHIDLRVLEYFSGSFETDVLYTTFDIPRDRDGIILQLMLQGFGRDADIRSIRDFRKDTDDILTDINLPFFAPLIIATIALVVPAIIALILVPKNQMVFQPPVAMEHLMSCARARDSGDKDRAFGHPQQKLMLGIVRQQDGSQQFSVDAVHTEKWEGQQNESENVTAYDVSIDKRDSPEYIESKQV